MEIKTTEHIATTEEYVFRVKSSDGNEYIYAANIINNHVAESSETDVYRSDNSTPYPPDHDEIVTKIEEQLTTMY